MSSLQTEVLLGSSSPEEVWGETAEAFVRARMREAKVIEEWRA